MEVIIKRFSKINEPGDFAKNEEGQEKLDSICMQLLTIGESLKQIDKITNGSFLIKYPQIDLSETSLSFLSYFLIDQKPGKSQLFKITCIFL